MVFTFSLVFVSGKTPSGLELWDMINKGPKIIRPTTVNINEPLRRVENVDIDQVCKSDFLWRNGRKCLGMFRPNGWKGKSTLAILLHYPAELHQDLVNEVYAFIQSSFKYRLLYGVSPNDELMDKNLQVHQLANCGAIPPDETIITENKGLFEIYEEWTDQL